MSDRAQTITVEDNPKFGAVIRCSDINDADALEDFLTANDVEDFSVRFSKDEVELFVGSVSMKRINELVSEFRNDRDNR
jgi:hypothetical protein